MERMERDDFGGSLAYGGSQIFAGLAQRFGLSVDVVNFLFCQVAALFIASLYRNVLHPAKVSCQLRHTVALAFGLFLGYFCFGDQTIHIAGLPIVCYVCIRTQSPLVVQKVVMVVAMAYLSCIHLHRQYYDYGSYSLDITCPLMIITQKVIIVAFQIHDGFREQQQGSKALTPLQQQNSITKLPTALEFFSYTLHFHGIMAGPLVFYRDYIDFIDGTQYLKKSRHSNADGVQLAKEILVEPSPMNAVIKKVVASFVCAFIFQHFVHIYPIEGVKSENVLDASAPYKLWYIMMATTVIRFKYYHAWLFADAICNNAGLGFNGYDSHGKSKWDLITNINVINFELGTNFRDCINNWNMGTNRWLRFVVYERVPKQYGTILTFSLSAIWHGFYPGYYITFGTGALVVSAARVARSRLRHLFQGNAASRDIYDVLTCFVTRFFMAYATFPFVLLEFGGSLRYYLKLYLCLHLTAAAALVLLPRLLRSEKRHAKTAATTAAATVIGDGVEITAEAAKTAHGSAAVAEDKNATNKVAEKELPTNIDLVKEKLIQLDNVSEALLDDLKKNLESLEAKTRSGIEELKDDLMKEEMESDLSMDISTVLRRREKNGGSGNLNAAVQSIPAVISSGNAK